MTTAGFSFGAVMRTLAVKTFEVYEKILLGTRCPNIADCMVSVTPAVHLYGVASAGGTASVSMATASSSSPSPSITFAFCRMAFLTVEEWP